MSPSSTRAPRCLLQERDREEPRRGLRARARELASEGGRRRLSSRDPPEGVRDGRDVFTGAKMSAKSRMAAESRGETVGRGVSATGPAREMERGLDKSRCRVRERERETGRERGERDGEMERDGEREMERALDESRCG